MINALKLLANQQEDGRGLLQNIVKDLGNDSRRGLTDGLREFIRWIMSAPWRLAPQRSNCCVMRSPMAGVGFLQSLWEKPIWEGVWPYLDPMDSVCLRTVSMEWNVPGKYGPHGVLHFFLLQKKLAIVPNSEAFNSFIGDGFQVPELKDESESSDGYQAGNVNNEGVACHWIAWIW